MPLAIVLSRAQTGMESREVAVEVDLAPGLPSLSIVGLAETAVKESKDRVRSAIHNAGFEFPTRRITVNLAPADLPKEGGRFDLPIAIGILAASGQLPVDVLSRVEFLGELALGGDLRGVSGVLPSVVAAAQKSRAIIVPEDDGHQAALAPSARVYPASHLLEVTAHLAGTEPLPRLVTELPDVPHEGPDLADVRGQHLAKRALGDRRRRRTSPADGGASGHRQDHAGAAPAGTAAAARRGSGPETASVWSLAGSGFDVARWRQRPFRSPHHGISAAALVGGGSPPKPGEISLAHNGVLFLDELPEFGPRVLDQLREPLETGEVHISRVAHQRRYPARFQLVAAMNLCRCGRLGDPRGECRCSPEQVRKYQERISGPLLDRIDIQVHVKPVPHASLTAAGELARRVHRYDSG
ncbi:MAG: ATP-binding protein [Gammaproteobacteria bacterium]|nr:ATP-binding protein [Gammaproteobacteria bacterium]